MIRLLAIDLNQNPAAAVVARLHPDQPIQIVALGELHNPNAEDSDESSRSLLGVDLPDGGFDRALALIATKDLVYASVELPFNDPKKISQVVPLQLQDSLPFEVSDCVLDTSVTKGIEPSSFRVLAALSPNQNVAETLASLTSLGVDPTRLSTHASVLAELFLAAASSKEGLQVVVNIQPQFVALALILDDQPCNFREWSRISFDGNPDDLADVISEVRASISGAEARQGVSCRRVYVLSTNEVIQRCKDSFGIPVARLELDSIVENHTDQVLALDRYCWAIGLAAQERQQLSKAKNSFDFRRGPFAYQRAWTAMWEALAQEATWILLALIFGLGYIGAEWWTAHSRLDVIEKEINRVAKSAETGQLIPARGELQFFEELVVDRENQLREMGSLASLSPLESLRVLSASIPSTVSVEVESITIGFSRILLRGSVSDNPTLGTLETALKGPSDQFCSVKVDPKGREAGSSRVKFVAEIEVCE